MFGDPQRGIKFGDKSTHGQEAVGGLTSAPKPSSPSETIVYLVMLRLAVTPDSLRDLHEGGTQRCASRGGRSRLHATMGNEAQAKQAGTEQCQGSRFRNRLANRVHTPSN